MALRITVELSDAVQADLIYRSKLTGVSVETVIAEAIERYAKPLGGDYVTGPLVTLGTPGPLFPVDENPHDLVFS